MNLFSRRLQLVYTVAIVVAVFSVPMSTNASIMDFNTWTIVEDPPNANFTSSVDSTSQVTLSATGGSIPSGTDIGYKSIDGVDVNNSSSGWAFDPAFDFAVAVDFDLTFASAIGGFSIGMGIGEDDDGTDSVGVILASMNGGLLTFAGAARDGNSPLSPVAVPVGGTTTGRFIVSYVASNGNVSVGVSTDGDDTPEGTGSFLGVQDFWDDELLMVSFFARGDNGVFNWSSGTADAIFSDFHVISGTPLDVSQISAVPEPASWLLGGIGLLVLCAYGWRSRDA